ncbi:histidine phosphatase family protein [Streptomyces albidoflavus]|uniref:Histidine phosphatase family protein n=2 Tax=Streptomyces albidoflavus TaxID=1886 RepID=A0AA37BYF3_9ACTN|nr:MULTISPECIES: histidine phosphatase family protein [Streptomyces]MBO1284613.1 histidine phosphatase family protein [Streptomyces sampsonii]MYQ72496.1 histidine phosphatase family protein [Streptomyces sp. SID4934]MYW61187.1 histidine phosphatase family protein [Streptomyces sp. SID8370]MYW87134.1 histidine phosphatase family protein [Streptomyces sp. SID8371]MYX48089.1 histidine phosphatase family protein [Streptomyces sp. SID8385]MYX87974.1 histidine phosphatase family protein [Streptomyc
MPTPLPSLPPLPTVTRLASVTVVRHGESEANVRYRRAVETGDLSVPEGRSEDTPLTGRGEEQAAALGRWLAAVEDGPELVVCSPYARARRTWEIAAGEYGERAAPPVVVEERVRDRENGVFALHSPPAWRAADPQEWARRERSEEWTYRPPGGESLADVALRVRGLLGDLDAVAAGRRVLVVAHDAVALAVAYVLEGLGAPVPDRPQVANASVSRWHNAGGRLVPGVWNSTGHL